MIEMTAVLALLFLLIGAGFSLQSLDHWRAESYVRGFVSDIRLIYRGAVYSDRHTRLVYQFGKREGGRESICGYLIKEDGLIVKTVDFPETLQVKSRNDLEGIAFRRSGQLLGLGETLDIEELRSRRRYRLTIVPFSGRVEVYEDE